MKKKIKILAIIVVAFLLGMYTHATSAKAHREVSSIKQEATEHKIGKASWYSRRSPGIRKRTANNEIFNDRELTCAMWGVPFNQKIKVTNLDNGKSVVVRVNDRGPHKRLVRKGRVIDLTKTAFEQIASLKKGLIKIRLELL